MQKQILDLTKKIDRLEERFIEEEIEGVLYTKFKAKYSSEKKEIERNLLKLPKEGSNLGKCMELAFDFMGKMHIKWKLDSYSIKQKIQFMLFPEGIRYNKKKRGVELLGLTVFSAL